MDASLEDLRTGKLHGRTHVKLECGLTEFPTELLDLSDSLEFLDLSGNQLSVLPPEIGQLRKLKVVFLSNNQFTTLPETLALCPNLSMIGMRGNAITTIPEDALPESLRWLTLTDNRIEKLPASIGKLKRLQKLLLTGNQMESLPGELSQCKNLELIRLSANRLVRIPVELFSLPKLAWLALAGNPFDTAPETGSAPILEQISWRDLEFDAPLGSGASGTTYRAILRRSTIGYAPKEQAVAVKVFKGDVTSDGLPLDECRAHQQAGRHPNLVTALGRIEDHPEGRQGLVFEIVPPRFTNLAGPPDFESCTRDVYPKGASFLAPMVLRIMTGIASAAEQLHARGVVHGDLYAHNTMVETLGTDASGHALLGDFGAAMVYDVADTVIAAGLERIEVRAFGLMLEELLVRCAGETEDERNVMDEVRLVQEACTGSLVDGRPSFRAVHARLVACSAKLLCA
jgi:hypothetical protein